jgi:hypothetical protein
VGERLLRDAQLLGELLLGEVVLLPELGDARAPSSLKNRSSLVFTVFDAERMTRMRIAPASRATLDSYRVFCIRVIFAPTPLTGLQEEPGMARIPGVEIDAAEAMHTRSADSIVTSTCLTLPRADDHRRC